MKIEIGGAVFLDWRESSVPSIVQANGSVNEVKINVAELQIVQRLVQELFNGFCSIANARKLENVRTFNEGCEREGKKGFENIQRTFVTTKSSSLVTRPALIHCDRTSPIAASLP